VPVGDLQTLPWLFQNLLWEAISERATRERPWCTIPKELFRWDRKTEFEEPDIGSGITMVNLPAA
jgi:hypothetical protein